MPARLARLGESLWLDEAWVANSLLTPTLRETLYFDRWAQSTPPLFLVIARGVSQFAGYSEAALRIVPLFAALIGTAILAAALRRMFSLRVAWLGLAMILANYWVLKYGQQVKQYGTDLLAACVLLLLIERIVREGCRQTGFIRLALFACAACFLSFTSVFWFASCIAAVCLPDPAANGGAGRFRWRRAIAFALLVAVCVGVNYLVFVRPNLTPAQFRNFAGQFFDWSRFGPSLRGLQTAFGALLIPLSTPLARYAVWPMEALLAFGAVRAVRGSLRRDRAAIAVLLAGLLPLVVAILASAARLYPLLDYPRFLIWAVPCLVVLFCYALAPAAATFARLFRYAAPAVSFGAVIASQFVFFAFPRPAEKNREAVEFIRARARGSDWVFVQGGMNEQFLYYRRLLGWNPEHVYFGNTDWPCCAVNKSERTTSPEIRDFLEDVRRAATRARGHTLWVLLPSAAPGHWSVGLAPRIDAIPDVLSLQGCKQATKQPFDQTLVMAFSCR